MHPLLKGGYTGHEKTYSGDVDISPGLAETKRNQQFLDKLVLPIFLGSSYFPQINTKTGYFGHILNLTVTCKVFIHAVLMENMSKMASFSVNLGKSVSCPEKLVRPICLKIVDSA